MKALPSITQSLKTTDDDWGRGRGERNKDDSHGNYRVVSSLRRLRAGSHLEHTRERQRAKIESHPAERSLVRRRGSNFVFSISYENERRKTEMTFKILLSKVLEKQKTKTGGSNSIFNVVGKRNFRRRG